MTTPTATPAPAAPPTLSALPPSLTEQAHVASANAMQLLARCGVLVLYGIGGLALAYALMHVTKTALKHVAPHDYRRLLGPVLLAVIGAIGGTGYWLSGTEGALAAGIGAASSALLHDVVDALRYGKKNRAP